MNKLSCDIIKDLIPLYIDEICSEDSAKAVTAHLESCPACKGYYDGMRAEIKTETVKSSPPSEVTILKRIKAHYVKIASLSSFVSLIAFTLCAVFLVWGANTQPGDEMGFSLLAFYVFLPFTAFISSIFLSKKKSHLLIPTALLITAAEIIIPYLMFGTFEILLQLALSLIPTFVGTGIGYFIRKKNTKTVFAVFACASVLVITVIVSIYAIPYSYYSIMHTIAAVILAFVSLLLCIFLTTLNPKAAAVFAVAVIAAELGIYIFVSGHTHIEPLSKIGFSVAIASTLGTIMGYLIYKKKNI